MKVESSLELSIRHDRPPSSTDRVHFIFPFPGKFQAFRILIGSDTIIDFPMDGAKLKLAQVVLSEGEISWHHKVNIVLIPLFHLNYPPCAQVLMAHRVLLYRRLHTPPAYF